MSNPSRERILGRIGEALKQKSPMVPAPQRPIFTPVGDLAGRLEAECKANYTECIFTRDADETQAQVLNVLASGHRGLIYADDTSIVRERLGFAPPQLKWSSEGPAPETTAATITRAEALIAATGSVLISSACGGRGGSIVAPLHIVLARREQLVPDIEAALELAERNGLPQKTSFFGVITGCSRTADIEKLLVIGAHGPKRLVVIVEG